MLQIQNRYHNQSICSEGQISNHGNDQDSFTTLKFNQSHDFNSSLKIYQKQKEKSQNLLEQATLRILLHADRVISAEKAYFKFPKMDVYIDVDCLFSCINNQKSIEGSNIPVINQFKKIKYTEISKKTNGLHIFFQKKEVNELPWQNLVYKMKSYGNREINEISDQIAEFCEQDYTPRDFSELSFDQSEDLQDASKNYYENQQKEEIEKIDEIFIQHKNKPIILWRGVNREFVSLHINECLINQLQYTPEDFQMEFALSGVPEFITNHNYNSWIKTVIKVLNNLFSGKLQSDARRYKNMKEFVTQNGQNISMEFEQYDLVIGNSEILIEIGTEEVKQIKKKPKKKQETSTTDVCTQLVSSEGNKSNNCLKINEKKRKLTDSEKYFINNHYFKIQDFDFNKSKVCKYRVVSRETQIQQCVQLHA